MAKTTTLDWIALTLLVVGGLNWGLVGLFKFDLVEFILGSVPVFRDIVYIIVGISAAYVLATHLKK